MYVCFLFITLYYSSNVPEKIFITFYKMIKFKKPFETVFTPLVDKSLFPMTQIHRLETHSNILYFHSCSLTVCDKKKSHLVLFINKKSIYDNHTFFMTTHMFTNVPLQFVFFLRKFAIITFTPQRLLVANITIVEYRFHVL